MRSILAWTSRKNEADRKGLPMSKLDYLQRVDVFKDLPREEIDRLTKGFTMRECRPGTVFFTPDDSAERLFILKKGHVELYRLEASGKRLVTRRLGPGTFFGEMGLLGQSMQGEFAESTEDAIVCTATREDVMKILMQHPEVTIRLLESIGNHLRNLDNRLEHAVFSPVRVRLAAFLLENAHAEAGALSGLTHAEIGETIGALRQTVTEALSDLAREGLVEVSHKKVRILNRTGLQDIASGVVAA